MTDRIEWRCDACRLVVGPKDGGLWVDDVEAARNAEENRRKQRAEAARFEREGPVGRRLGDHTNVEQHSRWQVHHAECDPDPDSGYWLEIERVSTHGDLLEVLAHVLEKPWVIEGTEVSPLIRRALSNDAVLDPKRRYAAQMADEYGDSLGDGARRDFLDE